MSDENPVIKVDKKVANNGAYNEDQVKSKSKSEVIVHQNNAVKKKIIVSKKYANGVTKNTLGALIKNGKVLSNYAFTKKELDGLK